MSNTKYKCSFEKLKKKKFEKLIQSQYSALDNFLIFIKRV